MWYVKLIYRRPVTYATTLHSHSKRRWRRSRDCRGCSKTHTMFLDIITRITKLSLGMLWKMTIGSKWFFPKALAKEPCKLFIGNPYPCAEYIAIRVDVSPFARPSGWHPKMSSLAPGARRNRRACARPSKWPTSVTWLGGLLSGNRLN